MQVYSTNVHSNNGLRQRPAPTPLESRGFGGVEGSLTEDISNRRLYAGVQQQAPFYMMALNHFHVELDESRL